MLAPLGTAFAQGGSTAVQTVDIMNKLWGHHPGVRANHAKGIVTEGSFTPSAEGRALSMATLFAGPAVPVTVRFSNSTGLPALPDGEEAANPHGMSLKFHLSSGDVDVVTNSLHIFPVATGEEFRDLLQAAAESPKDAPKPTKVEQFVAAHPSVVAATAGVGTPSSFARETYNGVNAFIFVDAAGKRQPFRFQFVPVAGTEHVGDSAKWPPDYLQTELSQRLGKAPVAFRMMAQLAEPGDVTKDATKAWPDDRRMVDLGTVTLTKADANSAEVEKGLRYLPSRLTPGIEVSDDPLISARVQSYVISFGRRAQ
jgi:catalase